MAVELDVRASGARRLAQKVCVVTGAGQGIGRAAARRLGPGKEERLSSLIASMRARPAPGPSLKQARRRGAQSAGRRGHVSRAPRA